GVPLPESAIVWGPPALSSIVIAALRLPAAAGLKLTASVQLAPAARLAGASGQLLVNPKSAALSPLTATLAIESAAAPVLASVTVCGALVDCAICDPKLSTDGSSETAALGELPLPMRLLATLTSSNQTLPAAA